MKLGVGVYEAPVEAVATNPLNPRRDMGEEGLKSLMESIKELGVIEPLIVRQHEGGQYMVIAGDRRLVAARMAGLSTVPVRVVETETDRDTLRLMLAENLQRQELNPIEEARAYETLAQLGLKQREIADTVNLAQSTVANRLRLLELPSDVQERIAKGELTAHHGVALARYKDFPAVASQLAEKAVQAKWGVERLEEGLPDFWTLEQKGLVKQIRGYNLPFSIAVCQACPLQAYRAASYGGYCLRPSHYVELEAEALKQREARSQERAEALQSQATTAVPLKEVDVEGSDYEVLQWRPGGSPNVPIECREDCNKRVWLVDSDNQPTRLVCLDKKCHARLMRADTRAKNKARKETGERLLKQLRERMDGLEDGLGTREWAVLALKVLGPYGDKRQQEILNRHRVPALEELTDEEQRHMTGYDTEARIYEHFSRVPITELAKAVVECVLDHELHNEYFSKDNFTSNYAVRWYFKEEVNNA